MIISHINGGLGNQMFQYAAGKTLSILNKTFLKLDVSAFEQAKLRRFDLLAFETDIAFATKQEIHDLLPTHNFEKAFQYFSPLKKRSYYREKSFSFDGTMLKLGRNVYLKGYFQSAKYFLPAEQTIRKDFTFKRDIIKHLEDFSTELKNVSSVSVHVRRGDFSRDPETAAYHGTLDKSYYNSAIDLIKSKISDPVFYFFSDDINWVKENLSGTKSVYVTDKITKNHFEDLHLMNQCKHNIIANSSFSWWGAWLNNNPGKIVIAPEKWFNKGPKDTQDLIPGGWLKI
ncbi:MAG TPA: alpha-1,2-fucosyltransferase [Chitinophagaceae bacterium]|nr:alpha-1,2-fucosyltransferase [Chitinophagaceae bacterium]